MVHLCSSDIVFQKWFNEQPVLINKIWWLFLLPALSIRCVKCISAVEITFLIDFFFLQLEIDSDGVEMGRYCRCRCLWLRCCSYAGSIYTMMIPRLILIFFENIMPKDVSLKYF